MRRVFLSPTLLAVTPIAMALVVFFVILLPHQPVLWVAAVLVAYVAWRILRSSVLVVSWGRVWANGHWHATSDLSRVSVAPMPLTPGASVVLLETRSGPVLNAGLWRLGRSGADRLANEIADAVEAARQA